MVTGHGQWWGFDVARGVAVEWSERGRADDVLGPYPSREAAEHWRDTTESRNQTWDDDRRDETEDL